VFNPITEHPKDSHLFPGAGLGLGRASNGSPISQVFFQVFQREMGIDGFAGLAQVPVDFGGKGDFSQEILQG
jgi:hypothetical protein